jgi:hypothetical protein
VLDAACFQGDIGGLFHHRFCTRQHRAGRQLHQGPDVVFLDLNMLSQGHHSQQQLSRAGHA